MFCTTFLSAPSEEFLESVSKPEGCLVPLHYVVLSGDELYAPLAQPCLPELLAQRSDRATILSASALSEAAASCLSLKTNDGRDRKKRIMRNSQGKGQRCCAWCECSHALNGDIQSFSGETLKFVTCRFAVFIHWAIFRPAEFRGDFT